MRLAIFGGTFDPIHSAHLELARRAARQFHLDRVLLVPAAYPPHKAGATYAPYEHRVRMAELACAGEPAIEVSRLEEGAARSYSIGTIETVRATLVPEDELFFIIGADAFSEIRTWKRWQDVARAVRFIVAARPGWIYDAPSEVTLYKLDDVDLPVSSSEIRRALAAGKQPLEVAEPVRQYIREHHLYGT